MNEITRAEDSRLLKHLSTLCREKVYGIGAQAFVSRGGEPLIDAAIGWSLEPDLMQRSTLHNAWCAIKPLGALAMGIMADRGEIDLDCPMGEQFSNGHPYQIANFSPRDILKHNAGMGDPRLHIAWLWPEKVLKDLLYESISVHKSEKAQYSEYAGWAILDAYIVDRQNLSSREFVKNEIIIPLGLEQEMFTSMTRQELEENHQNIGPTYFGLPQNMIPGLGDRAEERALSEERMGSFGFGTMRAFGRIYMGLLKILKGKNITGFPSHSALKDLLSNNRGLVQDAIIDAKADFAGGFMVDLSSFGFAGLSAKAFGHLAMSGNIFMFADPERDITACVHLNGVGRGSQEIRKLVGAVTAYILEDCDSLELPILVENLELNI